MPLEVCYERNSIPQKEAASPQLTHQPKCEGYIRFPMLFRRSFVKGCRLSTSLSWPHNFPSYWTGFSFSISSATASCKTINKCYQHSYILAIQLKVTHIIFSNMFFPPIFPFAFDSDCLALWQWEHVWNKTRTHNLKLVRCFVLLFPSAQEPLTESLLPKENCYQNKRSFTELTCLSLLACFLIQAFQSTVWDQTPQSKTTVSLRNPL